MENKILVIYVSVAGLRSEDIPDFINKVTKKITPTTFEGEVIILPIQSLDSRVECINPKYITDADLVKEHTEMMKKLQIALQEQLELLKKQNKNE